MLESGNTMSSPPLAKSQPPGGSSQQKYQTPSPQQSSPPNSNRPSPPQRDSSPPRQLEQKEQKPKRKPPIRDPAIVSAKEATLQQHTGDSKPAEPNSNGHSKDLRSKVIDKIGELIGIVQEVIDHGMRARETDPNDAKFLSTLKDKLIGYGHRTDLAKAMGRPEPQSAAFREPRKLTDPMKHLYTHSTPPGFDSVNPPRQHSHPPVVPSRPPNIRFRKSPSSTFTSPRC